MSGYLVNTQKEVDDICARLSGEEAIGVDTEFLRVRTYYPKLALVQVSSPEAVYCFDPLAAGVSMDGLWRILADRRVRKVMHAARQDVEVLLHTAGIAPAPLFDTQIAAGLSGQGEQAGYATLVEAEFGVSLAKSSQRTDWTRRPLSDAQLGYAADDVRYLLPLYQCLTQRLESLGRTAWAEEDFEGVLDPGLYDADPEQAYRRTGRGAHLKPAAQHRLKRLCAWRERTAQKRDLPRSWVMNDDTLVAIATAGPRSREALSQIDGVRPETADRYADAILADMEAPQGSTPVPPWSKHEPLSDGQKVLKAALVEVLKAQAAELGIAQSILLTRADAERLARGTPLDDVLHGWRRAVVGPALEGALSTAPTRVDGGRAV